MRPRCHLVIVFACAFALPGAMRGQEPAPRATPTSTLAALPQNSPAPVAQRARDASWLRLPSNVAQDEKRIWWEFPKSLAHGQHLMPTLAIAGATAGLIATDPQDAPYFRRTPDFQTFNRTFSGQGTSLATAGFPALFYGIGLLRKDSYAQKTSLLAGEALADSLILSTVLKISTDRLRPSDISPQGNFADTFFEPHHAISSTSFPSGHTIAAFSVATVFAERYRSHRWVPWVAYGAAVLVGFSRITLQAHFPSDVFLGAALGYSVSRFAVLGP
jgi:membrane-associated phospholipid phosphatase